MKKYKYILLFLFIFIFLIVYFLSIPKKIKLNYSQEDILSFNISNENIISVKIYADTYNLDFIELLTYYALENKFFKNENINKINSNFIYNYDKIKDKYKNTNFIDYYKFLNLIFSEIKNFPIPVNKTSRTEYFYNNTWGAERTYGGKRKHLGTDILSSSNEPNKIEIISMTDGTVENLGWNEKGGYRVGIRSKNGNYYYYAHLSKFSENLKVGSKVKSGDFLGYMGDTGYSTIEGTSGKFPVHLHLGIEVNFPFNNNSYWINPYPFLTLIEYLDLNKIGDTNE